MKYLYLGLFFLFALSSVQAAVLPADFIETRVIENFQQPTSMAFAPDGRLFVNEKGGSVRVIKNAGTIAELVTTPFITLTVDSFGERGLLGVAFDPAFQTNKFVYLYYTVPGTPPHNRLSRFTANGDVAVAGSEQIILELNDLSTAHNHNGGALHFGPDGKLYIGVGENGSGPNAQNQGNLLGKILRINPDGSIPSDNPFINQAGKRGEIWAYGFRNPFTFAIHRTSGLIYVNDVGQNTWEEVNTLTKGANYGWPTCEGSCSNASFTNPVYQYGRIDGAAITGAAFYDMTQFPAEYHGDFFFGDYTRPWIKKLDAVTNEVATFATDVPPVVDIAVGPDGALYTLSFGHAAVSRYSYNGTGSCTLKSKGDANCNGTVDLIDFEVFRKEFTGSLTTKAADFDANGNVQLADFEIWRKTYLKI